MSLFGKFKFRIGAKLAVSAGIGVVLVAGMLGTQMVGNGWIARSNDEAIAQRAMLLGMFDYYRGRMGRTRQVDDL